VLQTVRDCAAAGVRAVVIITAGFREADEWGEAAQAALSELAAETGIHIAGPNSIGMVAMGGRLLGSFVRFPNWRDGPIAIIGQTGVFAGAIAHEVMESETQRPGVRASLAIGNGAGVGEADFLAALDADEHLADADFDTIFMSCTNLPAFGVRDRLKERFGVPVVTSNQAALASALKVLAER
jgi:acyl-CoA synthetase (NDP forming)